MNEIGKPVKPPGRRSSVRNGGAYYCRFNSGPALNLRGFARRDP